MSETVGMIAVKVFASHGYSADAWPYLKLQDREEFYRIARDILTSMREPTQAMLAAVENDAVIQGGLDDCNQHDIPEKSWRLMVDAALT